MAIDFFNTYPQNSGAKSEDYPFGSFRNETAPNAEDGTTLEQKWSNDWLAFFSRLLVEAAMTPSGDVDTVKVSQYYDALLALIHRERREVSNDLNGTRTEVAASENALRLAYELASAAVKKTGDTMTGDLILQNKLSLRSVGVPVNNVGSLFKFENESGTLAIRRGRADGSTSGETRIVMPNKAGTVALESTANPQQTGWSRDSSTGIITQWGKVSGRGFKNFPTVFPESCFSVVLTHNGAAAAIPFVSGNPTRFGFNFQQSGAEAGAFFMAIGK